MSHEYKDLHTILTPDMLRFAAGIIRDIISHVYEHESISVADVDRILGEVPNGLNLERLTSEPVDPRRLGYAIYQRLIYCATLSPDDIIHKCGARED